MVIAEFFVLLAGATALVTVGVAEVALAIAAVISAKKDLRR